MPLFSKWKAKAKAVRALKVQVVFFGGLKKGTGFVEVKGKSRDVTVIVTYSPSYEGSNS